MSLNHATASAATVVHVAALNNSSVDFSGYLATWDDSTTTAARAQILIAHNDNADSDFLVYQVTGASTFTSPGGGNPDYYSFPVTYLAGVKPGNGDAIVVGSSRTGDTGATGATGSTGATGPAGTTDHGTQTGLGDDDHTQYALLAGRSGGQTVIGGAGTTDDLILRVTSGVGTTGADMIFQGGNNGATEFARFLNSGFYGIGTNAAETKVHVQMGDSGVTPVRDVWFETSATSGARGFEASTASGGFPSYVASGPAGVAFFQYDTGNNRVQFGSLTASSDIRMFAAAAERLRITSAATSPASALGQTLGTTTLGWGPHFFADNAAQPSPGTNQAAVYAYDSGGGTTELYAADEAGNDTLLSPHYDPDRAAAAGIMIDPDDPYPRVGYERNGFIGKEAFTYTSPTTGLTQRVVRDLPKDQIRDWDAEQEQRFQAQADVLREWTEAKERAEKEGEEFNEPEPAEPIRKSAPKWIADRIVSAGAPTRSRRPAHP